MIGLLAHHVQSWCCFFRIVCVLLSLPSFPTAAVGCREVFKFHEGAPLHDPCAVAAVVAPELFDVSAAQESEAAGRLVVL